MKLDSKEFRLALRDFGPGHFITCASFEERCLEVPKALVEIVPTSSVLCFQIDRESHEARVNSEKIEALGWGSPVQFCKLMLSNPLMTSDTITQALSTLRDSASSLLVDISTFTHEHLAILVRGLQVYGMLPRTNFVYVSVAKYGRTESDEPLWLSRGVCAVRSVVGFPGMLRPSRPMHFIALVGFEFERAQVAIDECEPYFVSLGIGASTGSVTSELHRKNQEFYDRVRKFVESRQLDKRVDRFEFSCIDPVTAKREILQLVAQYREHNIVLFPMNTKASTLGAIFAAISDPSIQLSYVEPIEYNDKAYSRGCDGFRLFKGVDLLDSASSSQLLES